MSYKKLKTSEAILSDNLQQLNDTNAMLQQEIVEHKRAEDVLRETQAILQAALDNSQAGIAIADAPSGTLRYVNDAGLLIRGGNRQTVVNGVGIDQYVANWQLFDLDGSPMKPDEVPLARAILFGETCSREFIVRRTIDDDRTVFANASPIRGDHEEVKAGIVVFMDITERKQAEEKLHKSEAQYRSLFENMLNGYAYYKMIYEDSQPEDLLYLDVNNAFYKLTGLKDVVGRKITEVVPGIKEANPGLLEIYGRVALTGKPEMLDDYFEPLKAWLSISLYSPAKGYCVAVFENITKRKQAEESIKASLKEKETLLKEIHHRVKNNLQIISSLLNLQAGYAEDEKMEGIFRECQERITAMAEVHQLLYKSQNFAGIDFGDYLREIASHLFRSYKTGTADIALAIDTGNITLPIDIAIPCGLIINELVTNALKYAFPGVRKGEIKIEMTRTKEGLKLLFEDNGIGFPADKDFYKTGTLGLKLVHLLVAQLDGSIEQDTGNGTRYVIMFKTETPWGIYAEP